MYHTKCIYIYIICLYLFQQTEEQTEKTKASVAVEDSLQKSQGSIKPVNSVKHVRRILLIMVIKLKIFILFFFTLF